MKDIKYFDNELIRSIGSQYFNFALGLYFKVALQLGHL